MLRRLIIAWLFLTPFYTPGQQRKIDSLYAVLKTEKEDTNKVNTLISLADNFRGINPDTTILLAQQAFVLSEKLMWKKGIANSYMREGLGYDVKGKYAKALDYYSQALHIYEELGNKERQAKTFCYIGSIYGGQGDYGKALDYDMKGLKIMQEIGNNEGQAITLGNIGNIYAGQGDYVKAMDYDLKALKIFQEIGNKEGQARNLGNIGSIYENQSDYVKALDYDLKALKIKEQIGLKSSQAISLINIGNIYQDEGNYNKALEYMLKASKIFEETGNKVLNGRALDNSGYVYYKKGDYTNALDYFLKALTINKETGDKAGQASTLGNIGALYTKTGKFKEAEEFLKKAIITDSSINEKDDLRKIEESLANLYDTMGRGHLAFVEYKKAMVLKDTLFSEQSKKQIVQKQMNYEFEQKRAAEKAEQDKKDAIAEQERKKQIIIRNTFIAGFALMVTFAFFIFRGFRQKQKANKIISKQKEDVEKKNMLIEEKNKDILDSITYAKRLQDAILPPLSIIKKYLPDSFLLYKPKDIVAGDFYWMERLDDVLLIAACDCTGHGVPGAMVSVVCSNALNRALKEFKIRDTGKLLDKVREIVLETFEKSEGEVKDGMDCSFCAINTKTKEIEWSGAYNPLWYIQNGELKELSPNKQPIGKSDNPKPFTTHTITLTSHMGYGETSLYLFTDGYADQFGGPKGKKFKYKQMQELLLANAHKPMEEQGRILNQTIEAWKGSLEQVDDVLVIGIRI